MQPRLLHTRIAAVLVLSGILMAPGFSASQNRKPGILGREAPAWSINEWYNLPEGSERLDVSDLDGKVIYLFGFQAWCPGCHSHGFPAMQQVEKHFEKNDDVAFVAVQTVFEGFHSNTPEKALSTVERFDLDIPVGHDAGVDNSGSMLMRRYRSGGTPWTVIIDRKGVVRYNDFSIKPDQAIVLIDRLLAERS